MEKQVFSFEVPTVIKVSGGAYNVEDNCTSLEIETQGLHIVFDLPGKHKSKFAQKRIYEAVRRLSVKKILHLADTRLYPVMQQLP